MTPCEDIDATANAGNYIWGGVVWRLAEAGRQQRVFLFPPLVVTFHMADAHLPASAPPRAVAPPPIDVPPASPTAGSRRVQIVEPAGGHSRRGVGGRHPEEADEEYYSPYGDDSLTASPMVRRMQRMEAAAAAAAQHGAGASAPLLLPMDTPSASPLASPRHQAVADTKVMLDVTLDEDFTPVDNYISALAIVGITQALGTMLWLIGYRYFCDSQLVYDMGECSGTRSAIMLLDCGLELAVGVVLVCPGALKNKTAVLVIFSVTVLGAVANVFFFSVSFFLKFGVLVLSLIAILLTGTNVLAAWLTFNMVKSMAVEAHLIELHLAARQEERQRRRRARREAADSQRGGHHLMAERSDNPLLQLPPSALHESSGAMGADRVTLQQPPQAAPRVTGHSPQPPAPAAYRETPLPPRGADGVAPHAANFSVSTVDVSHLSAPPMVAASRQPTAPMIVAAPVAHAEDAW